MKFWLCVTNPFNWLVIRRLNVWGVDDRYEITMRRLRVSDKLVFYATKMRVTLKRAIGFDTCREEDRTTMSQSEQCIVGTYEVKKPYFQDKTDIGWVDRNGTPKTYPHRVETESLHVLSRPLPLKEPKLFNELYFIADKSRTWYFIVYPSMVLIPQEDYEMIESFVRDDE